MGTIEPAPDDQSFVESLSSYVVSNIIHRERVDSQDLDRELVDIAEVLEGHDLRYGVISTNVELDLLYKATPSTFSSAMKMASGLLDDDFMDLVERNGDLLDCMVDQTRDQLLDAEAIRDLKRTVLLRRGVDICERPQYMYLRLALAIHGADMDAVSTTYGLTSRLFCCYPKEALKTCGRKQHRFDSNIILESPADPIELLRTAVRAAQLSGTGAKVGIGFSKIDFQTCGNPSGSSPDKNVEAAVKMVDAALEFVEGCLCERRLSTTINIDLWHSGARELIHAWEEVVSSVSDANRTRIAVWIPDLFMSRLKSDGLWSTFCPSSSQKLMSLTGREFESEYYRLEDKGVYREQVKARVVWCELLASLVKSGGPYIMFKDSINECSNHQHVGIVSQTCASPDSLLVNGDDAVSASTTASIVLPSFVKGPSQFDFSLMEYAVRHLVFSLNRCLASTKTSSAGGSASIDPHRSLGIGVQGLAEALVLMGIPYDSEDARVLNQQIAEAVYYVAVDESADLIKTFGTYSSFKGSPISQGMFQFDLCKIPPDYSTYDWGGLRKKVVKGVANSTLISYMSTEDSSILTGCTSSVDPLPRLVRSVRGPLGSYVKINKLLVQELTNLNLWNDSLRTQLIKNRGSLSSVDAIPIKTRNLFKTAFEIDPMHTVIMAANQTPYTCQGQSVTFHLDAPDEEMLGQLLLTGWSLGLKVGIRGLRTE